LITSPFRNSVARFVLIPVQNDWIAGLFITCGIKYLGQKLDPVSDIAQLTGPATAFKDLPFSLMIIDTVNTLLFILASSLTVTAMHAIGAKKSEIGLDSRVYANLGLGAIILILVRSPC